MKKLLLSLVLCSVLIAMLTGPVGATGAMRIPYTGVENPSYCFNPPLDPRCGLFYPGDPQPLPNGKTILRNLVFVLEFVSDNPLFNGVTTATFNIYPGSDMSYPMVGTWHLEPYGYDGYWEGPVSVNISASGGTQSVYSGKGYGALEGMIVNGTNDNGNLSGVIIDLP